MIKPDSVRRGFGLLLLIFSLLAVRAGAQPTPPQSPVPLPVPFNPIVDNANVIDDATRQKLESIYLNLKERGQIEYAVVTVDTTGDRDIFDYSLAIARGWGIGPKNGDKASFLLVVAVQDRKYFTQVSRHIEGDLPDGLIGQIQRERLVPPFRQGNYSKGILDTVQSYAATLAAKRGFNIEGIDQRYVYRERPAQQQPEPVQSTAKTICFGILVLVIIVLVLSSARRAGGGGGCLQALLLANVFNTVSGGGRGWRGSSGWGGGGFGGGGGGGGFGGGFGGGGDFGGGGAGGSW